jgi:hypothetical protein
MNAPDATAGINIQSLHDSRAKADYNLATELFSGRAREILPGCILELTEQQTPAFGTFCRWLIATAEFPA